MTEKRPFQFPANARELIGRFLEGAWPRLAGFAWRQYMESGRGAVVLPWMFGEHLMGIAPPYLAAAAGFPDVDLAIAQYDPERSVVFVVLGLDDYKAIMGLSRGATARFHGPAIWRVLSKTPPPPRAHQAASS